MLKLVPIKDLAVHCNGRDSENDLLHAKSVCSEENLYFVDCISNQKVRHMFMVRITSLVLYLNDFALGLVNEMFIH